MTHVRQCLTSIAHFNLFIYDSADAEIRGKFVQYGICINKSTGLRAIHWRETIVEMQHEPSLNRSDVLTADILCLCRRNIPDDRYGFNRNGMDYWHFLILLSSSVNR